MDIAGVLFRLVGVAIVALWAYMWWRIMSKAGYPGLLGLLMLVPPINLVLLIFFAFVRWPIEGDLQRAIRRAER